MESDKQMFHSEDSKVKNLLLKGQFGLEKESLRINKDGFLSHTPHPFSRDEHIVRDFCENQTEINTPVCSSAEEAVQSLSYYNSLLQKKLKDLGELLWQFSNPPYIKDEKDIPIARFSGNEAGKTIYREYLAQRYGKYKMSLSGVHVNFSFDEELLKTDFALSDKSDYEDYKNSVYLKLACRMVSYSWILTVLTAASPLTDSSFQEKGKLGKDVFYGMASLRCSELGYWNYFVPILDYSGVSAYTDSIQQYVTNGFLLAPSEFYYPVRLKPKGINTLDRLKKYGINHIELRMFDLNPFAAAGVDTFDVEFAHLLMVWLMCVSDLPLDKTDQVNAVQNFKNAAHYDLKTVRIIAPNGESHSVVHTAKEVIASMREFYGNASNKITTILDFEEQKLTDPNMRYAWRVRREFGNNFVQNGTELAKRVQMEAINNV